MDNNGELLTGVERESERLVYPEIVDTLYGLGLKINLSFSRRVWFNFSFDAKTDSDFWSYLSLSDEELENAMIKYNENDSKAKLIFESWYKSYAGPSFLRSNYVRGGQGYKAEIEIKTDIGWNEYPISHSDIEIE